MIENQDIRPAQVIGPLGEPLTLDDLPSPKTKRWVMRRKAEVVAAVNGGLLTIDEVLERYNLTLEEFASWQRAMDRSGMKGLRGTRIQKYRDEYERKLRYNRECLATLPGRFAPRRTGSYCNTGSTPHCFALDSAAARTGIRATGRVDRRGKGFCYV